MTGSALAAALRSCAAGLYPAEAACDLLIAIGWPGREDFSRFITTGTSISDGRTLMAAVDWHAAISSLDAARLPCCGSERRLLRLAASLADGIPVDLQDAVTELDTVNINRVTAAIRHAAGHHATQVKTVTGTTAQ
jgi:hypothetical protein